MDKFSPNVNKTNTNYSLPPKATRGFIFSFRKFKILTPIRLILFPKTHELLPVTSGKLSNICSHLKKTSLLFLNQLESFNKLVSFRNWRIQKNCKVSSNRIQFLICTQNWKKRYFTFTFLHNVWFLTSD